MRCWPGGARRWPRGVRRRAGRRVASAAAGVCAGAETFSRAIAGASVTHPNSCTGVTVSRPARILPSGGLSGDGWSGILDGRWTRAASAGSASSSRSPCAVLLAGALVYTSFSASSEARTPASWRRRRSRAAPTSSPAAWSRGLRPPRGRPCCVSGCATAPGPPRSPIRYTGAVPDPFREGREVIVNVRKRGRGVRRRARLAGDQVPVEVLRGRARPSA